MLTDYKWQIVVRDGKHVYEHGYYVVDEDPLTFISDTLVNVTYALPKPENIRYFQIQARNDDNNVKQGNLYELMYWDQGWRSAGRQVANDTFLLYKNLPSGALYWLRNHTGGQEENIFMLDENGSQFWPRLK